MYSSHVEFMPENGFSDLPIHQGSISNKPSNFFELEAGGVSFTFAILKTYCGRGVEERLGSASCIPEKF